MSTIAETIKGISIVIGSDTTALSKALASVNKNAKDIQTELKQVEKLLKLDPGNTELLAQKHKLLANAVETSKEKLEALKKAQEQVNAQFAKGDINEGQYRAFQREVAGAEQELSKLESQAIKTNAVLSKDEAIGNLKKMGMALAGLAAAGVAALAAMAVAALNNADELQRLSDVSGLSAERLQELQYAGNNLGVGLETITGAQAKLTKAMFAAKEGTGKQAAAFSALGISITDSNGELRDSKTVMAEAFTALSGIGNETERDALAMQIFGKSAMELNPLIKAGGEELNRLSEEARNSGAVMSNEAVAGLDLFGDTLDNLKTAVLGGFGEKFAEILPNLQAFLDRLKELPQWIEANSTLLTLIGVTIGTITALIIAFNIQQALMASGLTLWSAIAGAATAATTALGTAIAFLTSPLALVVLAIAAIVAAGILLYQNWDEIKIKAQELWEKLTETWNEIKAKTVEIWDKIMDFFKQWYPLLLTVFLGPLGLLAAYVIGHWEDIKAKTAEIWNGIESFLSSWWDSLVLWVSSWQLWTHAAGAWNSLKTNVIDVLSGLASEATAWGENIVQGLIDGISEKIGRAVDAARNLAEGVNDAVKSFLDIKSPSGVMYEAGVNVAQGLANGIGDSAYLAVAASTAMADGIKAQASGALDAINSVMNASSSISSGTWHGDGSFTPDTDGANIGKNDNLTDWEKRDIEWEKEAKIFEDRRHKREQMETSFNLLKDYNFFIHQNHEGEPITQEDKERQRLSGLNILNRYIGFKGGTGTRNYLYEKATAYVIKNFGYDSMEDMRSFLKTAETFSFAKGGIATRPTLGIFGEAGAEAILPLANLLPMMTNALLGAIQSLSPGQISNTYKSQGINIHVENKGTIVGSGGMREFARTVSTEIARATGLSMGGAW